MVSGSGNGTNVVENATRFFAAANSSILLQSSADEARAQITHHSPGTFSNMFLNLDSNFNDGAAGTYMRMRKNSGNATQEIWIDASTSGFFEDTTHTDAVNNDEEWNHSIVTPESSTSGIGAQMTISAVSNVFSASSGTSVRHATTRSFGQTATGYAALSDAVGSTTTEAHSRFDCNTAGTFKNLYVYVSAWTNTSAFTSTVTLRKNGSGSGCPTVAPTGTGVWEDVTNSIAVVANDDACYETLITGTGTFLPNITSVEFASTNQKFHSVYGMNVSGDQNAGLTRYAPVGGALGLVSTSVRRTEMQIPAIVSNLTCYVSANSLADGVNLGTSEWNVRKNDADGSGDVNVSWGSTGQFEDTTYTDTFTATDYIDLQSSTVEAVTGSITYRHVGVTIENTDLDPVTFIPRVMFF
jgi:hypothetical protein